MKNWSNFFWILISFFGLFLKIQAAIKINHGDIKFYFYKDNITQPHILLAGDGTDYTKKNAIPQNYNKKNSLVVIIHGFQGSHSGRTMMHLRNAYLKKKRWNVVIVDWERLAGSKFNWNATRYYSVVKHSDKVAKEVANWLLALKDAYKIDYRKVTIVGFSIGAHIAGNAASALQGATIGKVIGLDPAYPIFAIRDRSLRLDSTDAEFVQVIHTCSGILGYPDSIGHVDFYPAAGAPVQPGCVPDNGKKYAWLMHIYSGINCSHNIAVKYYVESMYNEDGFQAVNCPSWKSFTAGMCHDLKNTTVMGYATPKNVRGDYYLNVNSKSPYGLKSTVEVPQVDSFLIGEGNIFPNAFKNSKDEVSDQEIIGIPLFPDYEKEFSDSDKKNSSSKNGTGTSSAGTKKGTIKMVNRTKELNQNDFINGDGGPLNNNCQIRATLDSNDQTLTVKKSSCDENSKNSSGNTNLITKINNNGNKNLKRSVSNWLGNSADEVIRLSSSYITDFSKLFSTKKNVDMSIKNNMKSEKTENLVKSESEKSLIKIKENSRKTGSKKINEESSRNDFLKLKKESEETTKNWNNKKIKSFPDNNSKPLKNNKTFSSREESKNKISEKESKSSNSNKEGGNFSFTKKKSFIGGLKNKISKKWL